MSQDIEDTFPAQKLSGEPHPEPATLDLMRMGIAGFEPTFLAGLDPIRSGHGPRLAALAGRRLTGYALVRFAENGEWFADCPVVLDFDGVRLELCHWKFDELSIGWNSVDTAAAITEWGWFGLTPMWSAVDDRLGRFAGQELLEVALLEYRAPDWDAANGTVAVDTMDIRRLRSARHQSGARRAD
jgi:hypothetical protein